MDNQKSVEVTKPETTAQEYYADAKQTITLGVRNLIRAFPLPLFMIDSILQGILLEYRNEAYMELGRSQAEDGRILRSKDERNAGIF